MKPFAQNLKPLLTSYMKPKQFISQLEANFPDILESGFINNGEMKHFLSKSEVDPEDLEGLVLRLYFLGLDPDKMIKFFINQYEEGRYLYLIKIDMENWVFVLSKDDRFAKLHFFINYLMADLELVFEEETTTETQEGSSPEPYQLDKQKLESALRIQSLLFPNMNKVLATFHDAHFFYEPKDMVGGDFYWAKKTKTAQWVVIGDCTGHSVEGALGSVTVMSLLNQVFDQTAAPHMLIKALHKSLNDIQEQQLDNGYGIGCELMVMKFDLEDQTLKYSSNGWAMYHVKNGKASMHRTKKSAFQPEKVIKYIRSRTLDLSDGSGIFLFSDGYPDQMNVRGKKIKRAGALSNLLEKGVTSRSVKEHVLAWRGEEPQTDDIVFFSCNPFAPGR